MVSLFESDGCWWISMRRSYGNARGGRSAIHALRDDSNDDEEPMSSGGNCQLNVGGQWQLRQLHSGKQGYAATWRKYKEEKYCFSCAHERGKHCQMSAAAERSLYFFAALVTAGSWTKTIALGALKRLGLWWFWSCSAVPALWSPNVRFVFTCRTASSTVYAQYCLFICRSLLLFFYVFLPCKFLEFGYVPVSILSKFVAKFFLIQIYSFYNRHWPQTTHFVVISSAHLFLVVPGVTSSRKNGIVSIARITVMRFYWYSPVVDNPNQKHHSLLNLYKTSLHKLLHRVCHMTTTIVLEIQYISFPFHTFLLFLSLLVSLNHSLPTIYAYQKPRIIAPTFWPSSTSFLFLINIRLAFPLTAFCSIFYSLHKYFNFFALSSCVRLQLANQRQETFHYIILSRYCRETAARSKSYSSRAVLIESSNLDICARIYQSRKTFLCCPWYSSPLASICNSYWVAFNIFLTFFDVSKL